ncbi:hypothetical protein [Herbaspirillum sp. RV1423]|uniref:hypothetical protein n=1 Tax=Herbaspirillum sp. RV1423 TaxID=1443993 RepID=UPI0018CC0E42|nr:hypothetical protein [Herbaspirillum sp. RV1423]
MNAAQVIVESLLNPIDAVPGFVDWCFVYLVSLFCAWVVDAVLSSIRLAGGGPAAAHFSCLVKKSKQKKTTAGSRPFGLPGAAMQKMGRKKTRFAQTVFPSYSIFRIASPAGSKRNGQTGSLRFAREGSPSASRFHSCSDSTNA